MALGVSGPGHQGQGALRTPRQPPAAAWAAGRQWAPPARPQVQELLAGAVPEPPGTAAEPQGRPNACGGASGPGGEPGEDGFERRSRLTHCSAGRSEGTGLGDGRAQEGPSAMGGACTGGCVAIGAGPACAPRSGLTARLPLPGAAGGTESGET